MCDQEVGSCSFIHDDCSAAGAQEEGADVAGADCCR